MAGTIFSRFLYFQVEDVWLLCTSWLMMTSASSGGEEGRRQDFESYRQTTLGVAVSASRGTSSGEHLEASDGAFTRGRDRMQSVPKQRLPSDTAALSQF